MSTEQGARPHPEWTTPEAVAEARRMKNRAVSMRQLISIDAPFQLRRLVDSYDLFAGAVHLPLLKPMEQEQLTEFTHNEQAKGLFSFDIGEGVVTEAMWDLSIDEPRQSVVGTGFLVISTPGFIEIRGIESLGLDLDLLGSATATHFKSGIEQAAVRPRKFRFQSTKVRPELLELLRS